MLLLFISFLAGVLTVLAPCILPLLPVIIGGSVQGSHDRVRPWVIAGSLAVAVVVFTLALKFSTALINIPPQVWSIISGGIIIFFGLISIFPELWEKVSIRFNFTGRSTALLSASNQNKSRLGQVLMGAALGPVFSSCSPTYFLILAAVLPQSFARGFLYLISYALGLAVMLLLVSLLGQRLVRRVGWAADPHGTFKRGLGVLFVLVGIFIMTGADKKLQTFILDKGFFDITAIEQKLLQSIDMPASGTNEPMPTEPAGAAGGGRFLSRAFKSARYPQYAEIVRPSGFVNGEPFQLADLVGKKVILLDFVTYSCINCIRTFPYLKAWQEKYSDNGLAIIAIHTPEFAFEKKKENVVEAFQKYGLTFPAVLDNDYATWNAYGNNYWPRKYLIDIDGFVVYDHIGEGGYEETERKIQDMLAERMAVLGEKNGLERTIAEPEGAGEIRSESPEIYFGAARNDRLGNGRRGTIGEQTLALPERILPNDLYLQGTWNFTDEYAQNRSPGSKVIFRYRAKAVYMVARSEQPIRAQILRDGQPIVGVGGKDSVVIGGKTYVILDQDRLYTLIDDKEFGEHTLEIILEGSGAELFTFTFG